MSVTSAVPRGEHILYHNGALSTTTPTTRVPHSTSTFPPLIRLNPIDFASPLNNCNLRNCTAHRTHEATSIIDMIIKNVGLRRRAR